MRSRLSLLTAERWRTGRILAAHGVATNGTGELYVAEFSRFGRVHKFERR